MQKCSGWKDGSLPNSTAAAWQWGSTSRCRNRGGSASRQKRQMKPPDREGRVSMHESEQEHGQAVPSQQAGKITALQRQWFELHRPSHGGYVCLTMAWPRRNGGQRNAGNPGKAKPCPGILAKNIFASKYWHSNYIMLYCVSILKDESSL